LWVPESDSPPKTKTLPFKEAAAIPLLTVGNAAQGRQRSVAGTEANLGERGYHYECHRPEQTLLYQLVEEYYPAFVDQLAAQGTELPEYVQREFEDYLKCGRLGCSTSCGHGADKRTGSIRYTDGQ
jgi:hypothetical protein